MLRGLSKELIKEKLDFGLVIVSGRLFSLQIYPPILEEIKETQCKDEVLVKAREEAAKQTSIEFKVSPNKTLLFNGRICVQDKRDIKEQLFEEAHQTPYSMHPGVTKMYQDLKRQYWWPGMKMDVIRLVEKCLTCQQIKAEHQRPVGTLQPLEVPK